MGCVCSSQPSERTVEVFEETLKALPDLQGKVVAITGCTSGTGFHLAEAAARKGVSRLLLLNRPSARAVEAEKKIRAIADASGFEVKVETVDCDLQDLKSVKACAEQIGKVSAQSGVDVLVNNAGIMAMPDKRTVDGYDLQMQTNHLSHVLLTQRLLPSLRRAGELRGEARIVFHSSSVRDTPNVDLEAEYFEKTSEGTLGGDAHGVMSEMVLNRGGPWHRYHQTKLANAAFAMSLHDKLQKQGDLKLKVMVAEPGAAATELTATTVSHGGMPAWMKKMMSGIAQSAQDGTAPLMTAAFSPEAQSGDFYAPIQGVKGVPIKTIAKGVPVKQNAEKLTTSQANKDTAWTMSMKVLAPEHFFVSS